MQEFHNEADTRAKLIDPALHQRGWSEDKIKREETPGAVDIVDGKPLKRSQGPIDYTLRARVNSDTQPVEMRFISLIQGPIRFLTQRVRKLCYMSCSHKKGLSLPKTEDRLHTNKSYKNQLIIYYTGPLLSREY